MKKNKFLRFAIVAALSATTLNSCDYLDVTPDEKITLNDVFKTQDQFYTFLSSCYGGAKKMNYWDTTCYTQSTDEHLNPLNWNSNDGAVNCACDGLTGGLGWDDYNKMMPTWAFAYNYIGQCHLFEKMIAEQPRPENVTEHDIAVALEETNFLKAFYYYRLLENFGPIPILDGYFDMNTPNDQIPGRRHFDYCVDFIVAQCDRAIESDLIPNNWEANYWGRITKPIAAALKSKVTLLAASPLWAGEFPFPNWKNTELLGGNDFCPDYDEKYGYELVAQPTQAEKQERWQRAKSAAEEAIRIAEAAGHKLLDAESAYSLLTYEDNARFSGKLELIYVPGITESYIEKLNNGAAKGSAEVAAEEDFLKRVCLFKYLPNSFPVVGGSSGNTEVIWGTALDYDPNDGTAKWGRLKRTARLYPLRTAYYNTAWVNGQGANGPTLFSAEHFWTENGVLPRQDYQWSGMTMQQSANTETYDAYIFSRADIQYNLPNGAPSYPEYRKDIVNLHVGREPRYYAWIAFDGGNFGGVLMKNAKYPLIMNFKTGPGYENDTRARTSAFPMGQGCYLNVTVDGAYTGFQNQKWTRLDQEVGGNSNAQNPNEKYYPMPIFKLAELYLNLAECCAALNDQTGVNNALYPIRSRALGTLHANIGTVAAVDDADDTNGFGLMEWVRNERFIELWDESQRYFDLRRWKLGAEYLSAGKREGMNITNGVADPGSELGGFAFDSNEGKEYNFQYFNKRKVLEGKPYTWTDRMYIAPIWDDEVYSAPKLVQAPNY